MVELKIKRIGVVGAGTMGSGIAQVAAQAGFEVVMNDVEEKFVQGGLQKIEKNLARAVERGKMTAEEKAAVTAKIMATISLKDLADSDLVVEAVIEDRKTKKDVLSALDAVCKGATVLASNTSSIPITELASATKRPDRVIGMHFINPVQVMKLVEVTRAIQTSDETTEVVKSVAAAMGKTPVQVNDFPGFALNRILVPMMNEAVYCLMEGVASAEAIDQVMKLGANHPMGPLELADLVGLDVCLSIMEVLYSEYGDPKYRPCPLLRRYVQAGWLGRKTGRGFYEYK